MALRNNEIYKNFGKGLDMDILDKKKINTTEEGTIVSGYACIQTYSLQPQKNGGQYISGQLQVKGQLPFKVWSDTKPNGAYMCLVNSPDEYKGNVVYIRGKVDKFGGATSLIIDTVRAVNVTELGLSESDFFEEVYSIEQWWGMLTSTLKKHCSSKAYSLFDDLMMSVKDRFLVEFAASYHHDNCKSGLLAHTTKVVKMASLIKMYPNITKRLSVDALFLACALHDIGKVYEYSNGVVTNNGKMISHHTFGAMIIVSNVEKITDMMGEKFYYQLLSVIEQHHGEYGERPRTALAYVVHLLDSMEANLTSLDSLLSESNGEQIQFNGMKLI